MSAIGKKLRTLHRVVRRHGAAGVVAVLKEKAKPFIQAPVDYARLMPSAATSLAHHGRPATFINSVGAGIGDDLLVTALFHELCLRGQRDFWVTTRRAELYRNNADVRVIVPARERYDILLKKLGTKIVYPWYTSYHPAFDRDDPMPEQHLISVMCQKAGITGEITLRPYLFLTDEEKREGKVATRQIAIQSSGLDAKHSMLNKNWPLERYQGVVSALKDRYDFVQVGSRNDPPLDGTLDMRGKTTLRGTAAVLHASMAFVGQVGFLMHLARAVDCRSVIVYGGRETPAQSGYPCNANLYSPVSCSPCWRLNTCPYERVCLQQITVGDVIDALDAQVARAGAPLELDTDLITPEVIERNLMRYELAVVAHDTAWAALYQ
ncbi:MAG TPA: glycosyltransferase family 9 protein [Gemmatimonadaceae bacterium]|nr:glycosyltransferase family 9 protein [Gemmatimonadaceae bacterium]